MTFRAERFHWGDDDEFDWHPPTKVREKDWDEGKHPREPAGSPGGGQFTSGGGGAPVGPAPKLPGVANIPAYAGRREDVHPSDGKKIYDNRVDPQYLTKSPKLKDVTEVTSGLNKRGNYYQRQWGRRDDKGDLIIIEVDRKGRISSPEWFKLESDPFEETVKLDRPEPRAPGAKPLLISERPNQEKLDAWNKQINDRQEELNKAGKTGEHEDDNLNAMSLALSAYSQEDQKRLDTEQSGLNVRYDLDNKLLGAAFTDIIHRPQGDVAKIAYFGATDYDAQRQVINDLTERWQNKVDSIEVQRWKDDPSLLVWKTEGYTERAGQAGLTNLSAVILEKKFRNVANPPDFGHLPVPVQVSQGVGTDFQAAVAGAISTIPAPVLKVLGDEGIKIRVGQRMTELNPELKGVHPRGWPPGMTWDSAEGMFDRRAKALNVTEFYRPVGANKFVHTNRATGVLLHESGHAYDSALDSPSATSNAFIDAYETDVKNMPTVAKRGLKYYLQKGKAGRSETFAETFAWVTGNAGSARTDLRLYFPHVAKLIKDSVDRGLWLEPSV